MARRDLDPATFIRGWMLDQRDEPAGHEPRRSHRLAGPRDFTNLDHAPGGRYLDPSSCAGRGDLECLGALAGVDYSLDSIALHARTILSSSS
jgi:hypothetical protein